MNRQDPDYPIENTFGDLFAVVTAMLHEQGSDDPVVEETLKNALEGTDHTMLVYNFGGLARLLLQMAADGRGQSPEVLLQEIAAQLHGSILGHGDE